MNDQDASSTSEDEDSNSSAASIVCSSSSSESDEMAFVEDPIWDFHDEFDSDVVEMLGKVQNDWAFEDFSEFCDDIGKDSSEAFKNNYVRKLKQQGGLHVHYSAVIQSMLQEEKMESRIFFLFITKSYFDAVRKWTSANINSSATSRRLPKNGLSESLFLAYVGLELGMSFCQFHQIKDYCSNALFAGHQTFKDTMARNVFQF